MCVRACVCILVGVVLWLVFYLAVNVFCLRGSGCAGCGGMGLVLRRIKLSAPAVYTSVQGETRKFPFVHKKKSERE